jgi:hypothetical protein
VHRWRLEHLCAEAWESALVLGVDWGSLGTATWGSSSSSWGITASAAASWAITTAWAVTAAWSIATSTTATASTATSTTLLWGLNKALVDLNDLLLLALTLTLGLWTGTGNESSFLLLLESLGGLPLLVLLATLVGLADLKGTKSELLLSLLDEVVGVRDAVVLWLWLGDLSGLTVSVLELSLSNGLGGLLILELSLTLGSAPSVSSLLLRLTTSPLEFSFLHQPKDYSPSNGLGVAVVTSATGATATTSTAGVSALGAWVTVSANTVIDWLATVGSAAGLAVTES